MFDHKAEAEEWLNYSGNLNSEATPEQVIHANGMAQAHATLYAAEQQRIANLIALGAACVPNCDLAEVGGFLAEAITALRGQKTEGESR